MIFGGDRITPHDRDSADHACKRDQAHDAAQIEQDSRRLWLIGNETNGRQQLTEQQRIDCIGRLLPEVAKPKIFASLRSPRTH